MSGTSNTDRLSFFPQYLLPHHRLSAFAYRLTRIRTRWLKNVLIRAFIAKFRVDLSDAVINDAEQFEDFNAFFTRALRVESRPIEDPSAVCCPVDGRISQMGVLTGQRVLQAKGLHYSLGELLNDQTWAERLAGGQFATLYLSPRDYHRVHMPAAGRLRRMVYMPGRLLSVSARATRVVPQLFSRNERVVCLFDGLVGPFAVVLVGACNVGSMSTVWAGQVTPPYGQRSVIDYPNEGERSVMLGLGAEMGRFNMGSTVIVVFPADTMGWAVGLAPDDPVRMGQVLGCWMKKQPVGL